MNRTLRKLHMYAQILWRALMSWKHIRFAEELGHCVACGKVINPFQGYITDTGKDIWHAHCARQQLTIHSMMSFAE